MRIARIAVVAVGWLACGGLCAVGWSDMYQSVTHDGQGLIPAGMLGIMWCLTGLAAGLAGNGISGALRA